MKELSLNILDITENSVKAGASLTKILITETKEMLTLEISDNGSGMSQKTVEKVLDPFYTTRKTRDVGLGLPLLQMEAMQTGGDLSLQSKDEEHYPEDHGTQVKAWFYKDSIDYTPLGDTVSTIVTLIQGHPLTDFYFLHRTENGQVEFDTREVREVLGTEVPLNNFDVIQWIQNELQAQYDELLIHK